METDSIAILTHFLSVSLRELEAVVDFCPYDLQLHIYNLDRQHLPWVWSHFHKFPSHVSVLDIFKFSFLEPNINNSSKLLIERNISYITKRYITHSKRRKCGWILSNLVFKIVPRVTLIFQPCFVWTFKTANIMYSVAVQALWEIW